MGMGGWMTEASQINGILNTQLMGSDQNKKFS